MDSGFGPAAPASVEELHARLLALKDTLPRRLRQCADFVSAQSDRIAISTVAELSAGAGVPPSAFMRFCQLLGFSGFSEMQKLFRDSYMPALPDYGARLDALRRDGPGSAAALLAEFIDVGRKSLEILAQKTDERALDAAVACLARARTIHLAGYRRAYPVASYLSYAFEKMGVAAVLHDGTGRLDHSALLQPGDVALAVTFAPYSAETVALAETAVARGLEVVAFTDTALSPVAPVATAVLTVAEVDFGAFRTLSASLALALSLAVAVGTLRARPDGGRADDR